MSNIFVLNQNVKLDSLKQLNKMIGDDGVNVFLTTNFMFENERDFVSVLFVNPVFRTFADYLTDAEMDRIDNESFQIGVHQDDYIAEIKRRKNKLVLKKVMAEFPNASLFVLSNSLGIDSKVWKIAGAKTIEAEYYYPERIPFKRRIRQVLRKNQMVNGVYCLLKRSRRRRLLDDDEVKVGHFEGKKYVFLGRLSRIDYRLDLSFETSHEEVERLNAGQFEKKDNCTYVTTWHEHFKYPLPDDDSIAVRWAQDGYLPPNYSHYDYEFKPNNVVYYCWDELGTHLFKNRCLPYEIIPFRKKLYMPQPSFPERITNVLIVASGSGDWTALKNRSDDDIMVYAFAQMAKRFPHIHFTYRCHPTWIHPSNVGVNAINRVSEYFKSLKLPNLTLSSNTPIADNGKEFQLSFSRSSLDEDLNEADFVFGEHSVSMIDAAFRGIPFCSVNLTKRRNFFIGMNELGFPTCASHEEIARMLEKASSDGFRKEYLDAVNNYNRMTDEEEE